MRHGKHQIRGILFIAACVLIALLAHVAISQGYVERADTSGSVIENADAFADDVDEPADQEQAAAEIQPITSVIADPAPSDDVSAGRCHMEECAYSRLLERTLVASGSSGRLLKLRLLGGSAANGETTIHWNKTPHDVYVYCSTKLPAVIMRVDGAWQVDVLDFVTGVPGILEDSQQLYGSACHEGDSQFPTDAEALGYSVIPDDRQDVVISKPEGIMSL